MLPTSSRRACTPHLCRPYLIFRGTRRHLDAITDIFHGLHLLATAFAQAYFPRWRSISTTTSFRHHPRCPAAGFGPQGRASIRNFPRCRGGAVTRGGPSGEIGSRTARERRRDVNIRERDDIGTWKLRRQDLEDPLGFSSAWCMTRRLSALGLSRSWIAATPRGVPEPLCYPQRQDGSSSSPSPTRYSTTPVFASPPASGRLRDGAADDRWPKELTSIPPSPPASFHQSPSRLAYKVGIVFRDEDARTYDRRGLTHLPGYRAVRRRLRKLPARQREPRGGPAISHRHRHRLEADGLGPMKRTSASPPPAKITCTRSRRRTANRQDPSWPNSADSARRRLRIRHHCRHRRHASIAFGMGTFAARNRRQCAGSSAISRRLEVAQEAEANRSGDRQVLACRYRLSHGFCHARCPEKAQELRELAFKAAGMLGSMAGGSRRAF